jgi:parvulin-like peptidyl-prolyl isomerase
LRISRNVSLIAIIAIGAIATVMAAADHQTQTKPADEGPKEPDYIRVQHILIGFQGSVPGKNITRTKEEAKKLAYEILERAKKGEDFGALVKEHTDDAFPGMYGMANDGKPEKGGFYPRRGMVPAFGNTGFPLEVGSIGIADHDPQKSPYGWHIVKRLE